MSYNSRRRHRQRSPESSDDEGRSATSFNKRRKTSESTEEIEKRLESLICRVGEKSSSSLESNLEGLAAVLEADLPNFKPQILRILVLCSYQLPEKRSIYCTLVGLLNIRNFTCGSEIIEMLILELKRLISTNQFDYAQSIVQFLGDLVNCHVVSVDSILALFEAFIDITHQENSPPRRNDWYVYVILATLPWVGGILNELKSEHLDNVLLRIQKYMSQRDKMFHGLLRVWSSDDPHPQEEYVECLFAQVMKLRQDGWVEDVILRPYKAFQPVLAEASPHNIPDFLPPPHIEGTSCYPLPLAVFRMFDYTDCPEGPLIPGNHAIERWLIEGHLRHLINTYKYDRKECANRLLNIHGREKIPLNHMIVECLFGDLFRLPSSPCPPVFYTAIFIELCKLQPSMIPQLLALSSDMLFERLDKMNYTCIDRFVNWFSQHLSNFQFRWSWDEWIDCLNEDLAMPRAKFIKEVLEKCMRLSYYKRVTEIVPPEFTALFPSEPKIQYQFAITPGVNVTDIQATLNPASKSVIAAIKNKCRDEEMMVILEELMPTPEGDADCLSVNTSRLELFLQALFHLSQKSFSHTFNALSKFHKVIKWAGPEEEGKLEILRVTKAIWKNHPQMLVVIADKMLRTQIVDCAAIAKWLFSPKMAPDFTRLYVWEIMHSTIRKMNNHINKLVSEAEDLFERSQLVQRKQENNAATDGDDMMQAYNSFAPDQEDLSAKQQEVDTAKGEQKKLFLIIFQRFIMILSDHLARCDAAKTDFYTPWYKNTIERLMEVFLLHKDTVKLYMSTLENLLFTPDLDSHILTVFKQFSSMVGY